MRRTKSKKQFKRNKGKSSGSRGGGPIKQRTARVSGTEQPYNITENNGTSGLLSPQVGVLSPVSGNQYVPILPSSIGTRCDQIARLYNEWRIKKLTYIYRPRYTLTTLSTDQVPPLTTGNQAAAAFGICLDPTMGVLTQQEVIEAGGRWSSLGRSTALTLTNTKWFYTQPRATDTLSDSRFTGPGNLYVVAETNGDMSTTSNFGYLETHWDIEFRFPVDSDVDAVTSPMYGAQLLKQIHLARQVYDEFKSQSIQKTTQQSTEDCKSEEEFSGVIVRPQQTHPRQKLNLDGVQSISQFTITSKQIKK